MDAIYIPQLAQAPQKMDVISVQEFLEDLDSLTPVQGQVRVIHQGNYLQVSAQAETIVTLTCDRCLQHYNHRLGVDVSELLWLELRSETDAVGADIEVVIPVDGPVETLSLEGYFDPSDWLYQQLCLQWPQRQLCDPDCPGLDPDSVCVEPLGDGRWAVLASLKQALVSEDQS
jgi:uncharacterized protein